MCDRPNVEITNSPIAELTEKGIVTADGRVREFDIVAVCTGYDAVTGGLRTMGITGRNGTDLNEKWKDGVRTHLGMLVNGYPNMFILYGPQGNAAYVTNSKCQLLIALAPTSLTNGPPFIELQCEWVLSALKKQREQNIRTVEVKKEEEEAWRRHCLELADKTLVVETDSWYMGTNIPGKPRELLVYIGGIPAWHQACQEALEGWKSFDVTSM